MKRLVLLIVLVMLATYFLRSINDDRPHYRGLVESPRPYRGYSPKRIRASLPEKTVDAEWAEKKAEASPTTRTISSQMMATKERAEADAIRHLREEVSSWLAPEVPSNWKPSEQLIRSLIRKTNYTPIIKDYGTLYVAEMTADTSGKRRESIVHAYEREAVRHRMMALGGSLAFVLVCLGVVSAYIRADEATKGYYTNRLRLLAAAGVGGTGVAVYRLMA